MSPIFQGIVVAFFGYAFGFLTGYKWGRADGKRFSAGKGKLRLFGEDLDD